MTGTLVCCFPKFATHNLVTFIHVKREIKIFFMIAVSQQVFLLLYYKLCLDIFCLYSDCYVAFRLLGGRQLQILNIG